MKNIFIIGSKGYNKYYGGWETFTKNLIDNYNDSNTKFYVTEISVDDEEIYNVGNVTCMKIKSLNFGSASMLLYTMRSFKSVLKYIINNNISNSVIYVLGLKLGPYLSLYKNKLRKNNIKVIVNPDGLEWNRDKWKWYVRLFFKYSLRTMMKNCDHIICDSIGIKEYLNEYKNKTHYIAYGTNNVDIVNEDSVLKEYKLKRNDYYLMVGRFVPENNYEVIISEFMRSNSNKKLVIISNIEKNSYYNKLINNTNFTNDNRIIILGSIYDVNKLAVLRKNAYAYIHGHSVGGTNPSLLESLSLTNVNILYDCIFNKEVGRKSCFYFNKNNNNLKKIIEKVDKLDKKEITKLGSECKKIIKENYTWDIIVDKYKEFLSNL